MKTSPHCWGIPGSVLVLGKDVFECIDTEFTGKKNLLKGNAPLVTPGLLVPALLRADTLMVRVLQTAGRAREVLDMGSERVSLPRVSFARSRLLFSLATCRMYSVMGKSSQVKGAVQDTSMLDSLRGENTGVGGRGAPENVQSLKAYNTYITLDTSLFLRARTFLG